MNPSDRTTGPVRPCAPCLEPVGRDGRGSAPLKVAFLDRDGTITADYPDAQWHRIVAPVFLDGAREALQHLQTRGYELIVVTNQYLIDEGWISPAQFHAYSDRFLAGLGHAGIRLLDYFYCPHRRDAGCPCTKPRPGMIDAARRRYPGIDLAASFVAGDWASDMALARNAGLRAFGLGGDLGDAPHTRVASLAGVLDHL